MAKMNWKTAVKTLAKLLAGKNTKECRAVCDLVIFAARGLKTRRWTDAAEFEKEVMADRRLRQIDPATIAVIVAIVTELMANKK